MRRSCVILVGALFVGACYHGQFLNSFPPAQSAAGIAADIRLRKGRVQGELLEVQDSALVLVTTAGRVTLIQFDVIRQGKFGQKGWLIDLTNDVPVAELRSLSRYPSGLTPELRARVLSAYGQTEIEVVR